MITIDISNPAYKNISRIYIKNDCSGRKDALHCNYYRYGRGGIGCPCILPQAKGIKTGEEFLVIEPEE